MDSGAFSTILTHGDYPESPAVYAEQIKRWSTNGNLLAAVAQDYMCEAHMLKITGKTIPEHQRLTIERYDALVKCDVGGIYVMPVLQGYEPEDYVTHIRQYKGRLRFGDWVGVGSVCKRNGSIASVEAVLSAIKRERPDLRLHGFGLKTTALGSDLVCQALHTADSMAWSYSARKQGRNGNDWREAQRFADRINQMPAQRSLFGDAA
jgi:transcriptional regulator of met regulon